VQCGGIFCTSAFVIYYGVKMTEEDAEVLIRNLMVACHISGDSNTLELIENILKREVRVR
jgi:hypothetical protein